MGRLLVIVVAFVLPVVVYLTYLRLARRKEDLAAQGRLTGWLALPWTWLIVAGVLLMVLMFLAMYAFDIDPDQWIGGESLVNR